MKKKVINARGFQVSGDVLRSLGSIDISKSFNGILYDITQMLDLPTSAEVNSLPEFCTALSNMIKTRSAKILISSEYRTLSETIMECRSSSVHTMVIRPHESEIPCVTVDGYACKKEIIEYEINSIYDQCRKLYNDFRQGDDTVTSCLGVSEILEIKLLDGDSSYVLILDRLL